MTNNLVSMKGGRATDGAFFNRCDASLPSLVRTSSTQPPPRRALALGLVQMWHYIFLSKSHWKLRRALRTPDDDMSFAQGYLRDVL